MSAQLLRHELQPMRLRVLQLPHLSAYVTQHLSLKHSQTAARSVRSLVVILKMLSSPCICVDDVEMITDKILHYPNY